MKRLPRDPHKQITDRRVALAKESRDVGGRFDLYELVDHLAFEVDQLIYRADEAKTVKPKKSGTLTRQISRIVNALFDAGSHNIDTLVLTTATGTSYGGWCRKAVADVIRKELEGKNR